jgi:hypothetical protein
MKSELSQATQTGFPSVTSTYLFESLMPTENVDYLLFQSGRMEPGVGRTRRALDSLRLNSYSSTPQERHNLIMRRPYAEKRMTIDADYATPFRERMNTLPEDDPLEPVFNMDEMCWRRFETARRVVEEKGKETVKLQSHKSEKTSFTALRGIACSEDKLPLWVIAKGKTKRSEAKFGYHPDILIKHTESGWATENLIIEYLQ